MKKRQSIYIGGPMREHLERKRGLFDKVSTEVNQVFSRYKYIMERTGLNLSEPEIVAVCKTLSHHPADDLDLVWARVENHLSSEPENGVDSAKLVNKLKTFTAAEIVAVCESAEVILSTRNLSEQNNGQV